MAFIKYTAVRFGITAVVFLLCLQLGLGWIFSALVAVIVAFCVSFLFLGKMRNAAAASVEHRFSGKAAPLRTAAERDDAAAEDAYTEEHRMAKDADDGERGAAGPRLRDDAERDDPERDETGRG